VANEGAKLVFFFDAANLFGVFLGQKQEKKQEKSKKEWIKQLDSGRLFIILDRLSTSYTNKYIRFCTIITRLAKIHYFSPPSYLNQCQAQQTGAFRSFPQR
jgi:hypothetical protein